MFFLNISHFRFNDNIETKCISFVEQKGHQIVTEKLVGMLIELLKNLAEIKIISIETIESILEKLEVSRIDIKSSWKIK